MMRSLFSACVLLWGCASTVTSGQPPTTSPIPAPAADSVNNAPSSGDDPPLVFGDTGDGGSDCPAESTWIYTVDVDGRFASFHPDTLKFDDIGKLNCPASSGAIPFSMAVDRKPRAWVSYDSSEVFYVDTKNASCTATGFPHNQSGYSVFGMGFVSDTSGSANETLFVSGSSDISTLASAGTLGSVNAQTLKISSIHSLSSAADLTGTGTGDLWGFFALAANPHVAKIDKATGSIGTTFSVPGFSSSGAWAFAQWGGDFWLFLADGGATGGYGDTTVYQLHTATGKVTAALKNTGRTIVGAGVSTCAPTIIQ